MLVLVTYDVNTETNAGRTRLRHVAKICQGYGIRVQNSVFECQVDASEYKLLKNDIIKSINKDKDSIRFYNLGNHYAGKVEHFGTHKTPDLKAPLIL